MVPLRYEQPKPSVQHATVIFMFDPVTENALMPLFQPDGSDVWFRITTNGRTTLGDLTARKYMVAELTPGGHSLVASSWAGDPSDMQVAVLDANVSAGCVYVVNLGIDDHRLVLAPQTGTKLESALKRLPQYERLALDPNREPHVILDSDYRALMQDQQEQSLRVNGQVTKIERCAS
jgi:hypothetical protein